MRILLFILTLAFCAPSLAYAGGDAKGEPSGDDIMFVAIDQVVVPIIKRNGKTGVISLNVTAEVSSEAEKEEVRMYMPRLRDAYIRALYGNVIAKKLVTDDGALNVELLKTRLVNTSNYVLKTVTVNDILLDKVSQYTF